MYRLEPAVISYVPAGRRFTEKLPSGLTSMRATTPVSFCNATKRPADEAGGSPSNSTWPDHEPSCEGRSCISMSADPTSTSWLICQLDGPVLDCDVATIS